MASERIEGAIQIATAGHKGQFRKWGDPPVQYIVHPIAVYKSTVKYGLDELAQLGAIYHDLPEDQGSHWFPVICNQAGIETMTLVAELTDQTFPKDTKREVKNIAKFKRMAELSVRAKQLKMLDRIDNLTAVTHSPLKWLKRYLNESLLLWHICKDTHKDIALSLRVKIEFVATTFNVQLMETVGHA